MRRYYLLVESAITPECISARCDILAGLHAGRHEHIQGKQRVAVSESTAITIIAKGFAFVVIAACFGETKSYWKLFKNAF